MDADALIERIDSMEDEIDSRLDSEIDLNALVQQRLELIDQLEAVTGERPTRDALGGLSDRQLMVGRHWRAAHHGFPGWTVRPGADGGCPGAGRC